MAKTKVAKQDFLEENLPQTRKDQFFDILKNQYKVVLFVGLMLLVFFLPILAFSIFKSIMIGKAYALYDLGEATVEQVNDAVIFNTLISDGANLLLYPILFVGVGGVLRIIRQLVYGEPVVFRFDFNKGIKDNFKTFLLIGLFVALLKLLISFIVIGFGFNPYIKVAAYAILYAVLLPPLFVMSAYSVIYANKFFTSLKQSFLLYLRGSWKFLGMILLIIVPYVLLEDLFTFVTFRQIIYCILIYEDKNRLYIINNSSRFDAGSIWDVLTDFGVRSMNGKATIFPYFENAIYIDTRNTPSPMMR